MPKKEFEAFTRLDASDVNTFLMDQSVMTFGSAIARDAAIDTPVEGQVTYLTDIDSLTVYNGTQWVTNRPVMSFAGTAARGSAIPSPVNGMTTYLEDSKALEVHDGSAYFGVGGLTHISTQPFSAVTSFSFPNDSFTANFDAYEIIFVHESSSTTTNINFRLRASGTDDANNEYRQVRGQFFSSVASATSTSTGMLLYGGSRTKAVTKLLVTNPAKSIATAIAAQVTTITDGITNILLGHAFFDTTKVFDSCSFIPSTGNITGYALLYGYRK